MEESHNPRLSCLIWHWGTAYAIARPEPGVWLAQRRDNRQTLRAASPEQLGTMIQADYDRHPVPRN